MHLSRREAIQRILAAGAALGTVDSLVNAASETRLGFDPDLLKKEIPWPRLLNAAERKAATALADLILPADELGPAASELGVVDFIDEWISAPYPTQVKDREAIRGGLAWIDKASMARNGLPFHQAAEAEQAALLDATIQKDTSEHAAGYRFFRLFRDRSSAGYFTTREGWKAIGYTGNIPIGGDYPPPPQAALEHAGLA